MKHLVVKRYKDYSKFFYLKKHIRTFSLYGIVILQRSEKGLYSEIKQYVSMVDPF